MSDPQRQNIGNDEPPSRRGGNTGYNYSPLRKSKMGMMPDGNEMQPPNIDNVIDVDIANPPDDNVAQPTNTDEQPQPSRSPLRD